MSFLGQGNLQFLGLLEHIVRMESAEAALELARSLGFIVDVVLEAVVP